MPGWSLNHGGNQRAARDLGLGHLASRLVQGDPQNLRAEEYLSEEKKNWDLPLELTSGERRRAESMAAGGILRQQVNEDMKHQPGLKERQATVAPTNETMKKSSCRHRDPHESSGRKAEIENPKTKIGTGPTEQNFRTIMGSTFQSGN
jgi:hypothetical protein